MTGAGYPGYPAGSNQDFLTMAASSAPASMVADESCDHDLYEICMGTYLREYWVLLSRGILGRGAAWLR